MRTIPIKELPKYSKQFGLPIRVTPGFTNALYIRGGSVPSDLKQNLRKLPSTPGTEALKAVADMSKRKKGGIVIGEKLLDPTILAHEKGHEQDVSFLSSLAPTVEKAWTKYHLPLVGTLGAMLVGELSPKLKVPAMVANLGAQVLSTVPVLYSEYKASEIAKQVYPEADANLLRSMFGSYLKEKMGKRVLLPGLAHLGHALIDLPAVQKLF